MSSQETQGSFKVCGDIRKPRHVFIWVLNSAKLNNQEGNMFLFNTYNIANGQSFTQAQLELKNGVYYPQKSIQSKIEISKTYNTLMKYKTGCGGDCLSDPTIDLQTF